MDLISDVFYAMSAASRVLDSMDVIVALGLILGLAVFILFMPKRQRPRFLGNPSLLVFHDYLNFRRMITTWFSKLFYIITACIFTISMIVFMFYEISDTFLPGFLALIIGNVLWRFIYEIVIVLFSIHENLSTLTDRKPEAGDDIKFGAVIGDMGNILKQQQEKLRTLTEAPSAAPPTTSPALDKVCSACGEVIKTGGQFCPKCGTKIV